MENNKQILTKINNYQERFENSLSSKRKVKLFKDMCSYIKEMSPNFYDYKNNAISYEYEKIIKDIIYMEKFLPCQKLLNISFNNKTGFNFNNVEDTLDVIIKKVREEINEKQCNGDLRGQCYNATILAQKYALIYDLKFHIQEINLGFKNTHSYGQHFFGIIEYKDKKYLIDPTYSQFFLLKRNFFEFLGMMEMVGPQAGAFMIMNDERKKVANKILSDGWIELKSDVLKTYLDGFALSYRNGLYYENYQDYSFTTPYTDNDYWNFLNGLDNQYNHEKAYCLGYQKRPLNKYYK